MLLYISLVTSALTALALASPHPAPAQLAQRDFASCQQDGLVACCLYASPSLASPYCSSLLQTSTVTAPTVTPFTNVTSTVVVTVSATDIIPKTTTSTTVITTTGTRTITLVSTSATTTTTTSTTTYASLFNRDVGPAPPPCVTQSTSYPASRLTFACSCLYSPAIVTVTPTAVVQTITSLTTSYPTVTVTITQTTTIPFTTTSTTLISTQTTTETSTTTTSTIQASATVDFSNVSPPGGTCSYGEFYSYTSAPNDPGPNGDYQTGVEYCRDLCASDPTCLVFLYLKMNPAYRNQGDETADCILDNSPYNGQYLQCSLPYVLWSVAYARVI